MADKKPAKKAKVTQSSKTGVKKKAVKKIAVKTLSGLKKPLNTSQTLNHLAERVGLRRIQVAEIIQGLTELVEAHIKKNGPGVYTLPGLVKFKVVRKPKTKEREGINPFTKEPTVFKAQPARNVVKVRPLKKLKDAVA